MRRVLGIVVLFAVGFGVVWWLMHRGEIAPTVPASRAEFGSFASQAAQFTPARFIRAEGDVVHFGLPAQVQRDGQTFIEYREAVGTLVDSGEIFREISNGPILLNDLPAGQQLRLDLSHDPTDPERYVINAIYILD